MGEMLLTLADIGSLLPVRPPLLMLDRALIADGGARLSGVKNITANDPWFTGHFPGHPILPGVLQVEAMAQLVRVAHAHRNPGAPALFLREARRIKFRRPVTPGDSLRLEAEVEDAGEAGVKVAAKALLDGQPASEAQLLFAPAAAVPPRVLSTPLRAEPEAAELLDCEGIMGAIPHRHPLFLSDRIWLLPKAPIGEVCAVGLKNITGSEPALLAQTQSEPEFPNALILESAAQVCCALVLRRRNGPGTIAYFMSIDRARFERPVIAGDRLQMEVTPTVLRERLGSASARVFAGDELVAETDMKFAFVKQ